MTISCVPVLFCGGLQFFFAEKMCKNRVGSSWASRKIEVYVGKECAHAAYVKRCHNSKTLDVYCLHHEVEEHSNLKIQIWNKFNILWLAQSCMRVKWAKRKFKVSSREKVCRGNIRSAQNLNSSIFLKQIVHQKVVPRSSIASTITYSIA